MSLCVAKGVVTATGPPAAGATTVVTPSSPGVAFSAAQPLKAVLLWTTGDTAAAAVDGHGILAIGWVTNDGGTIQQAYTSYFDTDALGTSATARAINTNLALRTFSASTPTVDMDINVTAWSDTSFTITWTDPPAAAVKIHYLALGGSDITAARAFSWTVTAAVATQNVTVNTGFGQPDLVFLNSLATIAAVSEASHAKHVFSVGKSATERRVVQHQCANAAATMNVTDAQLDAFLAAYSTAGALQYRADLSAKASWPVDGFQVAYSTQATGASFYVGLALKGTFTATINKSTVPTAAAPQTQNLSHAAGGTPRGAVLFGAPLANAVGVVNAAGDDGGFMFGATDGTSEGFGAVVQDHGNTTSMAGRVHSETKAIGEYIAPAVSAIPTLQSEADSSLSASTLDLAWNDTDTVAREYSYVILGDAVPTVTPVTGSDSGTGTETSDVQATVPGSDSSTGTDAGTVSATVSSSDSGTGTDGQVSIVSPVSGSDSATGSETGTASVTAPGSDSATGTESGVVTETGAGGEGGAGSEAGTVSVTASGSDSAVGTDAGTVVDITGGPTLVSDSDSGSGSETGLVVDLTVPEPTPEPEVGGGGVVDESAIYGEPVRQVYGSDQAVGFEVGFVTDLTPKPVRKLPPLRVILPPRRAHKATSEDVAHGSESQALSVQAQGTDSGRATETGNVVDLTPEDPDELAMVMALLFD